LTLVTQLVAVLFAITVHEAAHGYIAYKEGDPTAKYMGRVTLNPIAHLDLIGTIIVPLFLAIAGMPVFGWAKPVPVDLSFFRKPLKAQMKVAAAGPVANFLSAGVAFLLLLGIKKLFPASFYSGFKFVLGRATVLDLFAIISVIFLYFMTINMYLGLFNLIPIPPLDGSKILMGMLPPQALFKYMKLEPYGFFILIALIYLDNYIGFLSLLLYPVNFLLKLLIL